MCQRPCQTHSCTCLSASTRSCVAVLATTSVQAVSTLSCSRQPACPGRHREVCQRDRLGRRWRRRRPRSAVRLACSSRQPASSTTGRPSTPARPISDSVPHSPPTATTTSADATTARLRAWPMPGHDGDVGVARLRASGRSRAAARPPSRPPRCAPREAASIAPHSPPVTTVKPGPRQARADLLGERARSSSSQRPARSRRRSGARQPTLRAAAPASLPISSSAPCFDSGSFRFPHFGDCTHEGQPDSHGHSPISRRASPTSRSNSSKPRRVIPTPPGWPS